MKSAFTIIVLLALCFHLQAQPGTLDVSFGDSGKVISNTYQGDVYSSLLQPDGKIIVGGSGSYESLGKTIGGTLLARYNTDGSLDVNFGDSGIAFYNLGDPIYTSGIAYSVALQSDGKIVAALTGYRSFAVMRVNSDGTVDKTFGSDGLFEGPEDHGYLSRDMALLPDGRIVLTGDIHDEINDDNRSFIASVKPNGSIDESFGKGGIETIVFANTDDINTVAITKEGKIIIGGGYWFTRTIVLLRYNGDGTADKSFGENGIAELAFTLDYSTPSINDIAIASDNTIATAGNIYPNNAINSSQLVCRFTSNGIPDQAFGTNGYTITSYAKADAHANTVAVQSNGEIITGGYYAKKEFDGGVTVARYDQDGMPDSTFGVNGIGSTAFTGNDVGASLLIQKDGKIVSSGYSGTVDEKGITTLARFNNDLTQRQRIITRIKRWLQHNGITWQTDNNIRYYSVQRSLDGGVTYQPLAKLYNNHQSTLTYEDVAITNDNTIYRIAAIAKDGSRSISNSILLNNESSVKLFPNPVRSTLQLQGLSDNKSSITITDFSGNLRTSATATGGTLSINTTALKPGNYLLKVQNKKTTTTQTFIKE